MAVEEFPIRKLSSNKNVTAQTHNENADVDNTEKEAIMPEVDMAGQMVDVNHQGNFTPEQDKKVLHRIDMVLMPLLFITNGFLYIDKACLTYAALFGLITDLKLYTV
jgi:hypothetical protein